MQEIKQSQATASLRQVYFVAKDATNPSQPKTGITWAAADIQVSKNGGAAANSAGTVTQVDATNFPGLYYYQLTTTECDTLGSVLLNIKNSAMVAQTIEVEIVLLDKWVANLSVNVALWRNTQPNTLAIGGQVDASISDIQPFTTTVNPYLGISNNGTATAGAAGSITLAASASATASYYNDQIILLTGGTGAGQARIISGYTTGKVASVSPNWQTAPDATTTYVVFASGRSDVGLWAGTAPNALVSGRVDSSTGAMAANVLTATAINAAALTSAKFGNDVNVQVIRTATMQAGSTSTTAVLDAAASATTDFYKGAALYIVSGTGLGQTRLVTAYNGTSKTASVLPGWAVTPDATSVYQLLPNNGVDVEMWNASGVPSGANAGVPVVDLEYINGTFVSATGGMIQADVQKWRGTLPNTLSVAGNVQADLEEWRAAVPAALESTLVQTNVNHWLAAVPNALVAGRVDASVGAMATDSVSAAAVSAAAVTKVVNGVLDENIFSHQAVNSTGRTITLGGAVLAETTAAGTPTTTTLPLTAGSAVDNFYTDLMILPVSGALAGQARIISGYVGATKTISVDEAWTSALTAGDAVVIIPRHTHPKTQVAQSIWDYVPSGTVSGSFGELVLRPSGTVVSNAGNTTLTFCTSLTATANDYYKDVWVCFVSGALIDQVHKVTAYDGTTKFLTFTTPYTSIPVAGTRFILINK